MLEIAFGSRPMASAKFDSLAQLVEHFPYKEGVVGSKPTGITKFRYGSCRILPLLVIFKGDQNRMSHKVVEYLSELNINQHLHILPP